MLIGIALLLWFFWMPFIITFANILLILSGKFSVPVLALLAFVACLLTGWGASYKWRVLVFIIAYIVGLGSSIAKYAVMRTLRPGAGRNILSNITLSAATGAIVGEVLSFFWKFPF